MGPSRTTECRVWGATLLAWQCSCWLISGHLESVSSVFLEQRVDVRDPLLNVIGSRFLHFIWDVERCVGLAGL